MAMKGAGTVVMAAGSCDRSLVHLNLIRFVPAPLFAVVQGVPEEVAISRMIDGRFDMLVFIWRI